MASLPVRQLLKMSLVAIPFVGLFALIVYISGDGARAYGILAKSYLSGLCVLITIATTPLPKLLAAARYFRVPVMLVEVTQLIYRYLFVLVEQTKRMQTAFTARGGRADRRAMRASSGMVAVLFSRSYERSSRLHQAMLARSFSGQVLQAVRFEPLRAVDGAVLVTGLTLAVGLHLL